MGWTPMQQAAIDKRKSNILVSAAAGSGKTAVLTERVFNRIMGSDDEPGIDIDRFLIVTFTSAAAHEMKERIADKISKAIEQIQIDADTEGQQEKLAYLEKQLTLLPKASISTIHSFCLKSIKNYFTYLEVDPNLKVGSESELQVLKLDVLEEVLEEAFEGEENEAFLELAETYGSVRGIEPLMELILALHSFSKSTIFPNKWLDEMAHKLTVSEAQLGESVWEKELIVELTDSLEELVKVYKEAIKLTKTPQGPALYEPTLLEDLRQMEEALAAQAQSTELMIQHLEGIQFGRLPSKKQECSESLKERVKAYRELAKEVIKSLQGITKLLLDPHLHEKTKDAGRLMQTLVGYVKTFDARYYEAKSEKGLVDYNDLEHLCLKLLVSEGENEKGEETLVYTEVAKELAAFYEEIYIDEYQDSNMVQETILGAVALAETEGPTRFMVGDMKQSIYRFRLANPLIFAGKYQSYDKYEPNKEHTSVCIDLSQNFRSRENILAVTNDLFAQTMSEAVGELEYDDDARLKVGNLYTEAYDERLEGKVAQEAELCLVEVGEGQKEPVEGEEETANELKNIELEALMVAKTIGKLLKGEGNPQTVFDKELKTYRKIEPRDIVILLRSVQDKANIFEEALLKEGIDAYADVSSNFFEAMEVQMMLSLLRVLDNPKQDIPMITVLRSPMVGLDFDEILEIRKFNEAVDFYESLCQYLAAGKGGNILKDFYEMLTNYRKEVALISLEELFSKLFMETGYYSYVGMLPAGAKKQANLKLLKKYAEDFERSIGVGLFAFLQYMDKLQASGTQIGEAKLVGESENLVTIMTIHKSKGLEFPIVFVCNTNKSFNNQDLMKNVLMHHELGLGPKYIDQQTHVLYETLPFEAIKRKIQKENISEEVRVLYVALTRAKEKLFVTGVVKDQRRELERWSQFAIRSEANISTLGLRKSPTYLNWIGMSLFAHAHFPDFREKLELSLPYLFEGDGRWKLNVYSKEELLKEGQKAEEKLEARELLLEEWNSEEAYSEHKEEIKKRLEYVYPYELATTMPVKVAVSDLKKQAFEATKGKKEKSVYTELGRAEAAEQETAHQLAVTLDDKIIPKFMRQVEEIKGAARGTLIHTVLEQLDLLQCRSADVIMAELNRLVALGKLQEEAVNLVEVCKLESIALSKMMERMAQSKHVWKEKAFVYLMPSCEVDETYTLEEEILLQGVVDTCFLEEDGLVVVDYKTDYVDEFTPEKSIYFIKQRYKVQLDLYARALGEITGLPVKEKWLYLYHIDEWILVD